MKIIKIISTIIIVGLFFNSCMMGPNFQKPEVSSPEAYLGDYQATDSLNLRWWELFNDPLLDTMVYHALEYNMDVQMAAKRIEQARAYHGMTKADLWPSLNIEAGAGTGNYLGGGSKSGSSSNQFYVTPALSWEIDFWGKYRRLSESAQADLMASEFGMRSMQISLISDVINYYFTLLDYKERLAISKNTLELRANSLDIIQLRFEKGIIPELDLNQAQAQWAIALASIPVYERLVAQTEYTLSVLLGENPKRYLETNNIKEQSLEINIPADLPSHLLERRPDIAQAEAEFRSQNAQIGAAVAARFPSFSLTGLFGVASNDLASLTTGGMAWSAGASLLGPLFQFGKNKRRVEMERKKAEEMLINYEYTVIQAFRDVEDALISISTLKKQFDAQTIYFEATNNASQLSVLRYDKGVTSYLEVLDSQRSAFEAELQLSETKQNLLNAYVALYKSLGGGWLNPMEEQQ
ncbi:MAG: transporter [Bacteroidetes bacterium 4572_77]|nr:MAG: transporter [Bacteroidetes bacterium 4572_77]